MILFRDKDFEDLLLSRLEKEYNEFHAELSLATGNATNGHNWRIMLSNLIRERDDLQKDQQWKSKCDAARLLVMDNIEEVYNHVGGVVGYKLNLTPKQTELICQILENDKRP